MKKACLCLVFLLILTACSHTYYVVLHAEKEATAANMTSDVGLSAAGQRRAEALGEELKEKHIRKIYSTNPIRTRATAEPLCRLLTLPVEIYGPKPDSAFISTLRKLTKNALIIGHSNTVPCIANGLTGQRKIITDLVDTAYVNLFVIKYTRFAENHIFYEQRKYGISNY